MACVTLVASGLVAVEARADAGINAVAGDASWAALRSGAPAEASEVDRIRTHLQWVEARLRAADTRHLNKSERQVRAERLDALRAYWQAGRFPRHRPGHPIPGARSPRWIDDAGVHCAVAFLIAKSGEADLVREVQLRHEYDYVHDMRVPALDEWARRSGLTTEELRLIQPSYHRVEDDDLADLEVTVPIAVAERSTTGIGGDLIPYSYDRESGLLTGLDLRLQLRPFASQMKLQIMVSAQHHAGPFLGIASGHAFRTTIVDAGLGLRFRMNLDDDLWFTMSPILGLSGMHADAGTGVGEDLTADAQAREEASATLDHGGLGWRAGGDISLHVGNFIVGLGFAVRQFFGIDTVASRSWVMDIGLRLGFRIDLPKRDVYNDV